MNIVSGLAEFAKGVMNAIPGVKSPEEKQQIRFEEDLIDHVHKKWKAFREARKPRELRWMLVRNFVDGNQYCDINIWSGGIRQIGRRFKWESREVFNKLAPIYEARLAMLVGRQPVPFVRPSSSSTEDLASAKVSAAVCRDVQNYNNMSELRKKAISLAELDGDCFIKSVWDPDSGETIGEDAYGVIKNGYVKKVIVPALEFFPGNNYATNMEDLDECIHAKVMSVEEVEAKFGKTLKGKSIDVIKFDFAATGAGGLGNNLATPTIISSVADDSILVLEYTVKPCAKFPKGAIVTITDDKDFLAYTEIAFYIEERNQPGLPFEQYACISNPTMFWSDSVLWRCLPIQRAYNAVKNRKHEALNRKAIGIVTMEDDGEVDAEDMENTGLYPGRFLIHPRGTQPPRMLNDNTSTTDFDNEEARLESMFETISGVSPFQINGSTPAGMVSGDAIEQLREQDASRISLTIDNINKGAIRGFKIDLRLCKQFASIPRIVKIIGRDNTILAEYWNASDLTTDDIIIDKEEELIQSTAQRKQKVIELMQYGLFTKVDDPKMRTQIMRIMELGDWENADAIDELHTAKAMRENLKFKKGIPSIPDKIDNHALHLEEHDRLGLSQEWEDMVAVNPELGLALTKHREMHEELQSMAMMKMAAEQMSVQSVMNPQLPA